MSTITVGEFIFALGFGKADSKNLDEAKKQGQKAAEDFKKSWKEASDGVGKAFKSISVAIAGAAVGLFKFVDESTESAAALKDLAARASLTTREVQRLSFIAQRGGASFDDVAKGLREVSKGMANAHKGSTPFADSLKRLGISTKELAGKDAQGQLGFLADKLGEVSDTSERAALAMGLFGPEVGPKLMAAIGGGSEEIEKLSNEAERLGLILSDEAINAADEFQDQLDDAKGLVKGLAREIGINLIPTAKKLISEFREWFGANKDIISQNLGRLLETLVPLLEFVAKHADGIAKGFVAFKAVGAGVEIAKVTTSIVKMGIAFTAATGPAGWITLAVAGIAALAIGMSALSEETEDAANSFKNLQLRQLKKEAGIEANKVILKLLDNPSQLADLSPADLEGLLADMRGGAAAVGDRGKSMAQVEALIPRIRKQHAAVYKPPKGRGGHRPGGGKADPKAEDDKRRRQLAEQLRTRPTGMELSELANRDGAGAVAVDDALLAVVDSKLSGATDAVARQAGLSRLGSATGKDYNSSDPLLSSFGFKDMPDMPLSDITKGSTPQVLISTINNTFTLTNQFDIDGAGDPAGVGDKVAAAIRDLFENEVQKSTKAAKVVMAR